MASPVTIMGLCVNSARLHQHQLTRWSDQAHVRPGVGARRWLRAQTWWDRNGASVAIGRLSDSSASRTKHWVTLTSDQMTVGESSYAHDPLRGDTPQGLSKRSYLIHPTPLPPAPPTSSLTQSHVVPILILTFSFISRRPRPEWIHKSIHKYIDSAQNIFPICHFYLILAEIILPRL